MKVALIGASGYVGGFILREALRRGHEVTAIVRHPEKIAGKHRDLTVKAGDVSDAARVAQLVGGHDAVISAYNPGWDNPEIYNVQVSAYRAIIEGVKRSGVKRLLVVGGAGSLEVAHRSLLVDAPDFPEQWKGGAKAMRDVLNLLRGEKELEWTFLSPSMILAPGKRTGKFRTGGDQLLKDAKGDSKISTEDFALALIDELEIPKHTRQRFTVGY